MPPAPHPTALRIVRVLRDAGHEALFAGGCVRDMLSGIEPADYDIATSAPAGAVARLFPKTVPVGAAFGVMIVVEDAREFEVATFRTEGPYRDGRHPESVGSSDARGDALRRDFTINGLFYDPVADTIIDYVGGEKDLRAKILRTIGDPRERFEEDRLRLMRAVRFTARFGLAMDPGTDRALRELAGKITSVAAERVRDELEKILVDPSRSAGMRRLADTGLLAHILPEALAMRGVGQPPQFHPEGDVFDHTLLCLEKLRDPDFVLALGTLLHDIGKPSTYQEADRIRFNRHEHVGADMTEEIARRLRISNEDRESVVWLVKSHLLFKDAPKMRLARLKRILRHPGYFRLKELHRVDVAASHGDMTAWDYCEAMEKKFTEEDLRPRPLLRGQDLIAMGLAPGPLFSKILHAVEEHQLEGKISTREDAEALAREMAGVETRPGSP